MTANSNRLCMEPIGDATHHRKGKYDKISVRWDFVRHLDIGLDFRFARPEPQVVQGLFEKRFRTRLYCESSPFLVETLRGS